MNFLITEYKSSPDYELNQQISFKDRIKTDKEDKSVRNAPKLRQFAEVYTRSLKNIARNPMEVRLKIV